MKKSFRLDRRHAVILGVCGGIANFTGLNATLVRIGVVVATLLGAFPWTLIGYGAIAWVVGRRSQSGSDDGLAQSSRGAMTGKPRDPAAHEAGQRRSEVEAYVAAPNSKLAREIEQLR